MTCDGLISQTVVGKLIGSVNILAVRTSTCLKSPDDPFHLMLNQTSDVRD